MKNIILLISYLLLFSLTNSYSQSTNDEEFCFIFKGNKINCTNNFFVKNGYWMYFISSNPHGLVYAEGEYKNGTKIGKWIYRHRGNDFESSNEVFYTEEGATIINLADSKLTINRDSTLNPDYSQFPKWRYRTWCQRMFGTNYYDCLLYNNRSQNPSTYEKKKIYGLYNAINEILGSNEFSVCFLDCILEKSSDYFLNKWYIESYKNN